jgi:hypothetical protein
LVLPTAVNVEVGGKQALLFVALMDKVVDCRHLVVLVVVNAFGGIVGLVAILLKHLENLGCGWD